MAAKGRQPTPQKQQNNPETTLGGLPGFDPTKPWGGLHPMVSYRDKKDDPIFQAFNKVVKERRAKGLPVFEYGNRDKKD
jgi:hypothetical protein